MILSLVQNFVSQTVMKSRDMQLVVMAKAASGQTPRKIFEDLMGIVSVRTIERWVQSLRQHGDISHTTPPGRLRSALNKVNINKIKKAVQKSPKQSSRRMAKTLQLHPSSVLRALRSDLGLVPYKYRKEPKLTSAHLEKRKKFARWVKKKFQILHHRQQCSVMKNCLTLMVRITIKMIECGPQQGLKLTNWGVYLKNKSSQKRSWSGWQWVQTSTPGQLFL